MRRALEATGDSTWVLEDIGHDHLRESSRESRFAISNGFLGVRATRTINREARPIVPPRTYVAGLFDTPATEHPISGLVPAADWLRLRILVPGGPLGHHHGDVSSHRRTLDMKRGALISEWRQSNSPTIGIGLRTLRLVSQSDRAVGLQLIQLEVEDGEMEVTLEASFDGMHLGLLAARLEQDLGVWHTVSSGKSVAIACASSLRIDGQVLAPTPLGPFKWSWTWKTRPGQVACFERLVAVLRSDGQDPDLGNAARDKLGMTRRLGWRGAVAQHEAAWATRWRCSDVEIEGDAAAQRALRFALYHLNSAANPADERVSIAARALTGDDYRGHVFWDTEIYLLPFYAMTWPEAARTLLMYRFHTLDAARAKAAGMGWRGALYAWESADTGAEMTPRQTIGPDRKVVSILCGIQEQHISADIAYAVWQYWLATGDEGFLLDAGAEILFETGRFWSSRAQLEADGHCHIRGVIGPDEYHEHIDDNAFTNGMARWNIRRALDVAALLRQRWPERWGRLSSRLGLDDAELQHWLSVAEKMITGLDAKTGLLEQFKGFFSLEEIDLSNYDGRSVPMDVVLGRKRTQKSQVIKQADVVALLGLLPDEFERGQAAENFRFYEPRCGHGSSLSRAMHGLVAARLGHTDMALRFFMQTTDIDLADTHVAIDGGVHIAALGGVWMIAVFGFAGLSLRSDDMEIDPHLPASWLSLAFSVQWRSRRLRIRITEGAQLVQATLESGPSMNVTVFGESHALRHGTALTVRKAEPESRTD